LDDQSRADQEPDQYGLLLGGYLADLLPNTDIECEYERVTNWTFNQMHEQNRYLNDGRPIGTVLGNDYDLASVTVIHWWRDLLQSNLMFSYYRQGEGHIDTPWTEPWVEFEGDYSEPFPTGVVEKTATVTLGLKGFLFNRAFVDLQAGVDWKRNQEHVTDNDLTVPFVRLFLSLFALADVGVN
jgi:hypothetical protein